MKIVKSTIEALGFEIGVQTREKIDFISLTDIAKKKNPEAPAEVVKNWMRNKMTIHFLGVWEKLHNPNFNMVEFDQFSKHAGLNAFTLSPKQWIDATGAIGLISKAGVGGGTFAHSDIAFEFASWISVEFRLCIIKDYQRLKSDESHRNKLEWNARRALAATNYRIHTDAIKEYLVNSDLTQKEKQYKYASEADMLNVALFGMRAFEWRKQNPNDKGTIRDYASIEELIILSNIESMNSELIRRGYPQDKRLEILRNMARRQAISLVGSPSVKKLKEKIDEQQ